MKAKDLRERSTEDLTELEKSLRTDYFQARLKNHTNRLDDTSAIRKSRRDLARVLTIIAQKSNGEVSAAKSKADGSKADGAKKAPAKKAAAPKAAKAKTAKAPKAEKAAKAPKAKKEA